MAGLLDYDCEGTLTIDGISMNRPAWAIIGDDRGGGGLLQLLTTVDLRGDDKVIPGAAGVLPFRRRTTATRYSFRLLVTGEVNQSGAANANPITGLTNNLKYLWTNVIDPPSTATGTVSAVWTLPDATTLSSSVHVVRCEPTSYAFNDEQSIWEGRLVISSPGGKFT